MQFTSPFFATIWANKVRFCVAFFAIFTLTYGFFAAIDFLPEPPADTGVETATTTATTTKAAPMKATTTAIAKPVPSAPVSITLPTLDRTVTVLNPASADYAVLDAALLEGVVRHPESAKLGEVGNVLILGHSSHLPTVFNRNYQAFNGIEKLTWGDSIVVSDGKSTFTYRVDKVFEAPASDVVIPTEVTGKRLTLVTCNNFGAKEDRFIVEATLVSTNPVTTARR